MPKVRNIRNGVVADVSEEDAQHLGPEWEPVEVKPKSAGKRSRKTE